MLSFADDLLLFSHADVDSVLVLTRALNHFGELSGLRANPGKSSLFLSASARPYSEAIQEATGFVIGELPVRYLGLPLITSKLTRTDCKPLLDRLDSRIGSWVNKALSYAGRIQLIRSVLCAFHIYWGSVFILPKGILREIERKMRNFLWSGSASRGHAKVSWETVCTRVDEGGLGIIPILAQNRALMSRNIWALVSNDGSSIWVHWIREHRLRRHSFWSVPVPSSCPWSWRQLLKLRPLVIDAFEYCIGDGRGFMLWHDPWHPLGVLVQRFPSCVLNTGIPLDAKLSAVIRDGAWCWPSASHSDVIDICRQLPDISLERGDCIRWRESSSGRFSSSGALALFHPSREKVVWAPLVVGPGRIPKHCFILWLAIHERLALREKPWIGGNDSHCVLCDSGSVETHAHLFFECPYSQECLQFLMSRVRFWWPHITWPASAFRMARMWRSRHLVHCSFRIMLAALVYELWLERNVRIFEDKASPASIVGRRVFGMVQDRLLTIIRDDSVSAIAVRRLWRIAW